MGRAAVGRWDKAQFQPLVMRGISGGRLALLLRGAWLSRQGVAQRCGGTGGGSGQEAFKCTGARSHKLDDRDRARVSSAVLYVSDPSLILGHLLGFHSPKAL